MANKNLIGLTKNFEEMVVHEKYLHGLVPEDFASGMIALAEVFHTIYTGMISEPQLYAMKSSDDSKGLAKTMNFLFLLAQTGVINNTSLEVEGKMLAPILKDARVTKPEMYLRIFESMGFEAVGLDKKIAESENIIINFPDNRNLLTALKAMVDAAGAFSRIDPNGCNSYLALLDYRILENYPAIKPKPTIEYALTKVKSEISERVEVFYHFIKPLAKCAVKGDPLSSWTATFTLKSTKKVIMSLRFSMESYSVKLNLANLGKYAELINGLTQKRINEIKDGGWASRCESSCNPNCGKPYEFEWDGVSYSKCIGGSFYFDNPDAHDSELLLGLLKKEIECQKGERHV